MALAAAPRPPIRGVFLSNHAETLVIGAGPAGLTAAYLLAKEGRSVAVLEAGPPLCRRHQPHGQPQRLSGRHRRPPLLLEVEGDRRALGRDPAGRFPRAAAPLAHLLRWQILRLSAARLRGAEQSRHLHQRRLRRFVSLRAHAPPPQPKTFHQWVRNHFGEKLFSIFFKTYTEKVWGMSCDEISADWAAQRIKGLDLGAAIRDAIARTLSKGRRTSGGGRRSRR